jgi:hypothetical protein
VRGVAVTLIEIEADWVIACEEAKIRLEQLQGVLGDF